VSLSTSFNRRTQVRRRDNAGRSRCTLTPTSTRTDPAAPPPRVASTCRRPHRSGPPGKSALPVSRAEPPLDGANRGDSSEIAAAMLGLLLSSPERAESPAAGMAVPWSKQSSRRAHDATADNCFRTKPAATARARCPCGRKSESRPARGRAPHVRQDRNPRLRAAERRVGGPAVRGGCRVKPGASPVFVRR
jgi:hypothetical protein